jgi:hypothetical protein
MVASNQAKQRERQREPVLSIEASDLIDGKRELQFDGWLNRPTPNDVFITSAIVASLDEKRPLVAAGLNNWDGP